MQSNELKSSRLSEVGSAKLPYSRMRRPFLRALRGRFERQTVQTTSAIVMLQNGDVFPSLTFARVGGGEIHSPGDQRALMEIIQLLQPRSLLQDPDIMQRIEAVSAGKS
jgi:hypothetical protein